jgi:hypothetical protein
MTRKPLMTFRGKYVRRIKYEETMKKQPLRKLRDRFDSLMHNEVIRAKRKFPNNFVNAHEGYATILEEVDELWECVKKREQDPIAMLEEAIQIAAMCKRFVFELIDISTIHGCEIEWRENLETRDS